MGIVSGNSSADQLEKFLNKIDHPEKNNSVKAYEHCIKADALRIKNLYWESISEYLTAITYDENNIDILKGLGLSYKSVGYNKSAIETLNKAKKIASFDKEVYLELGICYYLENKFEKAFKALKTAIKLDPNYIYAQFHLAITHELANEVDLAIKIYTKIIEEKPSFIAAYNNLGGLYLRIGMSIQGIDIFQKIIKINPDFARAYLGIAVCYDKMGNKNNSVRYYKKYMQMKPESGNIPYIIDRITTIKSENPILEKSHLRLVHTTRP